MTLRDTIEPKSDQLNYDDLLAGPLTVRVVGLEAGTPDQPVIVKVVNAETGAEMRPWKPCKSMRRVLISCWGDRGKEWIGKRATLYGDPAVRFGGVEVGGIRVSHLSGIAEPRTLKLTTTRSKRADFLVRPLPDAQEAKA